MSIISFPFPFSSPLRAQWLLYRLCPVLVLVLLLPMFSNAQNKVTINRAKEVVGVTMAGERVRKLIGDVSLKTEDMVMYCDSAYQYLEKNEVRAFSNIEIDTPEEHIYADTLIYYTDVDFSQLRGRVVIVADSATLYSQAVDYRFSTKVGHFIDHVRLEDSTGVLTAHSGYYFREPDSAVFRGNVQLEDSTQYVEGDSLFINRRKNTYRLYGDLFVNDRKNNVMLKGDSLKADSVGHRWLQGNAWLKRFEPRPDSVTTDTTLSDSTLTKSSIPDSTITDSATAIRRQRQLLSANRSDSTRPPPDTTAHPSESPAPDTTHIQAKIIHSIEKVTAADTQRVINAYENVRIWSPKFSAIADTAHYNDQTETFELISNPIAWHKHIQLTGPYIKVGLKNSEIDRLISYPHPFVVNQDTTTDRLNQVTGDTLHVNFVNGEISRLRVFPNSHLLYFTKNENDEPDGAIDMTAPSTTLYFRDGAPDTMKARGPIDGSYLPKSDKTAERKLDGFTWSPKKRPQEPTEPMKRRLPPIPKEPPFELPPRYLQAHKEE